MSTASDTLAADLRAVCGERIVLHPSGLNELSAEVPSADLLAVAALLRDAPTLQFAQLIDVAGVDFLDYGRSEWQAQGAESDRGQRDWPGGAVKRGSFGSMCESAGGMAARRTAG